MSSASSAMAQASLVQDVFLGFEPRLRARRLGPWASPAARLLFQLDLGDTLDQPHVRTLLETLAQRIEVIAWEPRQQTAPGTEALQRSLALASDGARSFGERPVFVGGSGLGAWIALASAATDGVRGVVALAPSLAQAGGAAPEPSPLLSALAQTLAGEPLERPVLVLEGRERPVADAQVVGEWLAEAPYATHLVAPGADTALFHPPWPQVVAAWVEALARDAR
jgi:hypothetical protein